MNLSSDIRSISYVKTNAADMLRQVNDTHNPIVITQNGEARAVLLDPDSYQEMRDALGMMKLISQSEREIQEGQTVAHHELTAELRARVAQAQRTSGEEQ
jgi:prevent-host-death family protein